MEGEPVKAPSSQPKDTSLYRFHRMCVGLGTS